MASAAHAAANMRLLDAKGLLVPAECSQTHTHASSLCIPVNVDRGPDGHRTVC